MRPPKLLATQRTDSYLDLAATVRWVSLTECTLTGSYSYNQSPLHESMSFKQGRQCYNVLGGKDDRKFIRDKDGGEKTQLE